MSSAGADCVITLVEIRSAPASAYARDVVERDATRDLDEATCGAVASDERHAGAHLVGRHVVEQHDGRAGRDRLLDLLGAVALDLDRAAGPQRRGRGAPRRRCRQPARWLSFTSTKSDSEPRWFAPPPARTAAFSSARSPGSVLRVSQHADGVAGRDARSGGSAVATPDR